MVGRFQVDDHFLVERGFGDLKPDEIGGDGEFAAAAVDEGGEADEARPAEVHEGVQGGAHRTAGGQHVINEDDGAVIEAEVHVGALGNGDGVAIGEVITVEGDVEGAQVDGRCSGEARGELGGDALGEDFATGADANEGQGSGGVVGEKRIGGDFGGEGGDEAFDLSGVEKRLHGNRVAGVCRSDKRDGSAGPLAVTSRLVLERGWAVLEPESAPASIARIRGKVILWSARGIFVECTMLGWQLDSVAGKAHLVKREMKTPVAGDGEILVRVRAAGIIAAELAWEPTTHTKEGAARVGAVPAHEFAGVVAAVGAGANASVGEEIYGMSDWFSDGALAEFCVTRPEFVAARPRSLSFAEAASVPISALTAWQGLIDRAKVQAGETVLVHGGAGGVGIFAVQLAKLAGARVITTAAARHREYLKGLGAVRVIDYHAEAFEKTVQNVDVVFDTVGGETLEKSWSVLSPKGRLITIVSTLPPDADEKTKAAFFIVEAKRDQLEKVAGMLDRGELKTLVDAEVPFERADAAFGGGIERKFGRGKIVVTQE